MNALREVLAIFDIVVNSEQLAAANKQIDSFVDKLKGVGAAVAAFTFVKGIAAFGEHVAETARAAEFGATRIGMQVDQYQKVAQVSELYGIKVEQLQIALRMLDRGLSDTGGTMGVFSARTRFARDAMHNLGLDAKQFKDMRMEQILPVLADAFAKIQDPTGKEQTAIALRLFGHRGLAMLAMMKQGGTELREQFAAAQPVFEDATIKSADRATVSAKMLGWAWDNLINNSFGKALLDATDWAARGLTKVVLAVKDLVKNSEIGKGVLVALGVAGAIVATALIAAFWPILVPILAIVAAFTALALIVDDFIVFMEGGHSVIGRFFNEMFGEGGSDAVRDKIKEIWEDFKKFVAEIKSEAFKEFLSDTKAVITGIRDAFLEIKAAIQWIEEHWHKLAESFDKFAHFFGGGTTGKADHLASDWHPERVIAAIDAPPSLTGGKGNFSTADDNAPPMLRGGATNITVIGGIDSGELGRKVKQTVDDHHNEKIDNILRDAMAGAGGSK